MKLKSLRIGGFKSFADPVELRFHGGITGVVGPNGCGKSNIADALRWVLGNQSPRTLRAERMEDVIFAGSAARRPMGMAEVLITLDNSDRTIPLEFEEVSITRRLFRSGESEYLLNGSRCRLMDITDLLADCGLGSSGYWILESEMVKAILSSRTEERRFLFDEAAGITRYKVQRHRAQLKLDAASGDLERLEDIISEVTRNVDQLRRQAAVLARYEKTMKGLHALEAEAAGRVAEAVRADLAAAKSRLSDLRKREQDLAASSMAHTARLSEARNSLELAQADLDRRQTAVSALEKRLSEAEALVLVESERARAAGALGDELRARARDLEERSAELDARSALAAERLAALAASAEDALRLAGEAGSAAEAAASRLAVAREACDESGGLSRAARNALEERRRAVEKAARDRERAAADLARLDGERSSAGAELEALRVRIAALDSEAASLEVSLEQASAGASAAETALEDAARSLEECRSSIAALEGRAGEYGEQARVLEGEISRESSGTIASLVTVQEGCEAAAGACLDSFYSARPAGHGVPADAEDGRYAVDAGISAETVPPGTRRLSEFLTDGPAEAWSIFSRAAMAPDRQTAMAAAATGTGLVIVTPGGDIFRPDGLVRLGTGAADRGPLERKAMLKALEARIASARGGISASSAKRAELEAARSAMVENRARMTASVLDLQKRASSTAAEARALREREARVSAGLVEIDAALAALPRPAEPMPDADGAGLAALEEADRQAAAAAQHAQDRLMECSRELVAASAERDRAVHGHEIVLSGIASAREGMERDRELASRQRFEAAVLSARAAESAEAAELHSGTADEARTRSGEVRAELEEASAGRLEAVSLRSAAAERAIAVQREADAARGDLESARAALLECATEAAALEEKLRPLEERAGDAGSPDPKLRRLADDDLAAEIGRVSAERDRLGPVNMLAKAEHEEAASRLEFLETQKADLLEARASISEAIGEINRTAAERFGETFRAVQEHFSEIFQRFFEGGEARLEAIPGEDPLEGGVSVMARPRGKTLESISALSGGEKAMTAVALLFALYLVRPAPFCVLDELDAPLDDANVDRFIDLLGSFSAGTQFIVVTHNRRTMEAAERLYGVTMAGNGVSALASVSLEEARRP
ncbi:MAG: AAA family ATPase [Candidatus Fermentibacter sp.]|nr:AAA family ATPase [Candidatus Fermentibacter sp.]